MKNSIILLILIVSIFSCTNKSDNNMKSEGNTDPQNQTINNSEPKVTGIGGVFFKSENPAELNKWYGENLGFPIDDYGAAFSFRNANKPYEINHLRWSTFDKNTDYFYPSDKDFMINYRVQNIDKLVEKLKSNGVKVLDSIVKYEYGKFVHILDIENNKIELWEPIDNFLTEMSEMDSVSNDESAAKASGIGGIFFRCNDPEKVKEWYNKNLGLAVNEYGSSFEFRNLYIKDEINYLQWSPFIKDTEYFSPSEKNLMMNYRVQNIDKLVIKLKDNGVKILDEMETYSYGKFIHIIDPEGNKIELWEPIDSIFTEMGGETTK